MFLRLQLALLALLFQQTLSARDPKLDALDSKISSQDRQITELRMELQTSRQNVQNRIDTATSGLEIQKASLELKLDQVKEQTLTAQAAVSAREQTIRALNVQLDQLRAHAVDTSTVAIAVAASAVNTAAKVATTRHQLDSTQLKTANVLASNAAENAGKAAKLGDENAAKLRIALGDIDGLTKVIAAMTRTETVGRRLSVITAGLLVVLIGLVGLPLVAGFRRK